MKIFKKVMLLMIQNDGQTKKCAILISFKIVAVFNTKSADIKTKSADVVLKTTTILREMRIPQMSS